MRGLEQLSATSSKLLAFAGFALVGMPAELEGGVVLALSHSRSITQTDLLAVAVVTSSACLLLAVAPAVRRAAMDADCRVLIVLTVGLVCLYVYLGDGARWLCLLAGAAAYGAVERALQIRRDADRRPDHGATGTRPSVREGSS